jgi:hypothetical protein
MGRPPRANPANWRDSDVWQTPLSARPRVRPGPRWRDGTDLEVVSKLDFNSEFVDDALEELQSKVDREVLRDQGSLRFLQDDVVDISEEPASTERRKMEVPRVDTEMHPGLLCQEDLMPVDERFVAKSIGRPDFDRCPVLADSPDLTRLPFDDLWAEVVTAEEP